MISIQIHGSAYDTTDSRYRAEEAALAVLRKAGCTPRQAEAECHRQFDQLGCEVGMTGLAAIWIRARDAAEAAASEGWHNPNGCEVSMHA
jgi:hypothetical protein